MTKQKTLKKLLVYTLLSLFLSAFLVLLYMFFPKSLESIDNRLRDYFFSIRGEIPTTNSIVIVDIDEKSLKELGQWPWSRNKVAKILSNLKDSNVGIIGLDIVFAEEDNSSPHKVLKNYNLKIKDIPNYDLEFANMVLNTPTILGYQFEFKDNIYQNKKEPNVPAIFIEKNKADGAHQLLKAQGTILNIPAIQNNGYSSGFFNNIPDHSGVIRSVPLIISYKESIYPSLALEILRIATNTENVIINYDKEGVSNIILNELQIPTDRHGRLLINYRGKEKALNTTLPLIFLIIV